ncbi:hypothetical protein EIP75_21550 [Aquabacterium soli]|uniref:Ribbon-helix-helix protein, CopG family n=1 Tax=Aquabacterium soli TaxID=2493092 RepID=A0A3R8T8S7_9BURK|nr:hypothetical protein [Aquabacterium soli]RRS01163.1 hypothetical protein EIP75_21550 [Aquabacterium soli]
MSGADTVKKTRKKRRGPGTDNPIRPGFTLRLEKDTLDRLNKMLLSYEGSRNEYIERLIEFDLQYRERIKPLNTSVDPDREEKP